jgi:PAS domain-containing protein/transcriptional regulator with XRE-family HTH domain
MPKRAGAARLNAISSRHYNQIIERFERLGTWAWDVNSGAMRWSDGLSRALGYDPASFEPSAEAMLAMAHPDDRWSVQDLLRDAHEPLSGLVRLMTVEGRYVSFSCHREIYRPSPATVIVLGVMHDVTEMRMVTSIVNQRSRILASLAPLLDGIMWRSRSDGAMDFGLGWCEFTGTTLADTRGDGWLQSVHPDDRASALAGWSQAVANRSLYATTYRIKGHDGGYRRFDVRASPLFNDDGQVVEWVGYCAPDRGGAASPSRAAAGAHCPSPAEVRAARGYLGWSVRELTRRSGVSTATLSRYENNAASDRPVLRRANLLAVRQAFEAAGVWFETALDGRCAMSFAAEEAAAAVNDAPDRRTFRQGRQGVPSAEPA